MDSDDEEGPVVEGWSIFENSTDSSSSETTLGLDAPQSPIWEDRLESFLRRRRAFSVDHEAAAPPTKNRPTRPPAPTPFAPPPPAAKAAPKEAAPPPPRLARAQSWTGE